MTGAPRDVPAPESFHDLFRGLAAAGVEYLLAGSAALALHGVPRLAPDVDLVVDPSPANLARARELLASWGYRCVGADGVLRFEHAALPIGAVDLVPADAVEYAGLRERRAVFTLADVPIPAVSLGDLLRRKEASGLPADRADAEGIRILEAVRRGEEAGTDDPRRVQIVKFARWHTENRCEWLLADLRLRRGLPPEQAPPRKGRLGSKPWRTR